jgi:hypothetical protein
MQMSVKVCSTEGEPVLTKWNTCPWLSGLFTTSSIHLFSPDWYCGTSSLQTGPGCLVTRFHSLRSRARSGGALGSATTQAVRFTEPTGRRPLADRIDIDVYTTDVSVGFFAMSAVTRLPDSCAKLNWVMGSWLSPWWSSFWTSSLLPRHRTGKDCFGVRAKFVKWKFLV